MSVPAFGGSGGAAGPSRGCAGPAHPAVQLQAPLAPSRSGCTCAVSDRNGRPLHLPGGSRTKSTPPARSMAASRLQHSTSTPGGGGGSGASLVVNVRSW